MAVAFEPSPELVDLGLAVGVLTGTPEDPVLDNSFFTDPGAKLGGILADAGQRTAALNLLSRVLDGAPGPGTTEGEQWVPLVTTETTPRLGLWGVVTERAAGAVDLSVALLVRHDGAIGLELSVTVPLVRLNAAGTAELLAGGPDGVIRVEAGIELGDAVALGDLSIETVTVQIAVPTDGGVPTVELRAEVPPTGDINDLVLDSGRDLGGQVVELLLRLGAAAAGDAADELAELLDLLGLGTDPAIPELPIGDLLANPVDALWGWVRSLAAPATATAWWRHLGTLVGAGAVTGTGTPTDPAHLCVTVAPAVVCLTLAVDMTGPAPVLVPGLSISVDAPVGFAPGGTADVVATLARITVGTQPRAELAPSLTATVTLGDPVAAGHLVEVDTPGVGPTRIDAVRAGLRVGAAGVEPVIEALGVDIGSAGTFAVLDLTDTDALLDVAGATLDVVVGNLLTALGADDTAEALLVLAGVRRPLNETEVTWPEEVALTELFSDPVGAVAAYHRTVLAAGRWPVLGAHLVRLLGTDAAVDAATGTGVGLDPWRIELVDTPAGAAHLLAWTTTDADGTRLHLGIELVPDAVALTATADGPIASLQLRTALVSLRLAAADGSAAPPDPVALASVGAALVIDGGLRLDAGFVAVDADRITAGVVWDRQRGLQPAFAVEGAELLVEPAPVPVTLPRLDPVTGRWVWDDGVPWELLERLLAAGLEVGGNLLAGDTARLLGWRDTVAGHRPAVPPPLDVPGALDDLPRLRLQDLVTDPLAALGRWVADLLSGPQGQEWAEQVLGWLARAAAGAAAGITGTGAAQDPWGAALGAGARTRLALTRGDAPAPLGRSLPLIPLAIADAVDGTPGMGAPPALHTTTLQRAAASLPHLADLLERPGDVAAILTALVGAVAGTDGLVPVASQLALPGAATVTEQGVGLATAAFQLRPDRHLPGGPPPAGRIFVRVAAAGILDWADVEPARTVDLTDPTMAAPAFDLTAVSGDGPWFVVLPSRAATGRASASAAHAELVARLDRVVARVASARPGEDLALIAHGPAGHVARSVAVTRAGVTHLTTIGTAHGGGAVDLAAGATAEGFRMLQSLRALIPDARGDLPYADELLRALESTLDAPAAGADGSPPPPMFPVADANPAGAPPALPATVSATAVASSFSVADLERALAEVVRSAIRSGVASAAQASKDDADRGGTSIGYRVDALRRAATSGVRVGVTVGPDLFTVTRPDPGTGLGPLPLAGPRLVVDVRIDRFGGWLVGSATAPLRARALDISLTVGIGAGGGGGGAEPACTLTVHDAGVLGVTRTRWVVDLADADRLPHLTPDERLLVGAALEALGPVPATGPARAAADLLAALGIVTIATGGTVTVDLTTVESALTRVANVLGAATDAARTQAITAAQSLLGGHTIDLGDGFELVVDLAARAPAALTLRTTGTGVTLPVGLRLAGSTRVDVSGRVVADIGLSSAGATANHRVVVTATVDTSASPVATVRVDLVDSNGTTVRQVGLLPTPDVDGLTALVTEVGPAVLLQLALTALRSQVPQSASLIGALGLGAPGERIRLPATLLADPVSWFLDSTSLGLAAGVPDAGAVIAVVDAVTSFTGAGGASGAVELPWGLTLTVADVGGDLTATLAWPAPRTSGSIRLGGSVGLALTDVGALVPSVTTAIDLVDAGGGALGGLSVGITPTGATAAARIGGTTIPLLPDGPGLGAVAAGATRALPVVLDAAASAPAPIGPAITALGDALGLRDANGFVEAELVALGSDPGPELVDRLRTNIGDGLAALEALVDPLFPSAGVVGVAGNVLTIAPVAEVAVLVDFEPLTRTVPAPPRVCLLVTGIEPVAGLSVSARACVSDGPDEVRLSLAVTDPALLLGLLPEVSLVIGPATPAPDGRVELALWTRVPADPQRKAIVGIADLGTGSVVVRCRHHDGSDHADLLPCGAALLTDVILPRVLDLVLAVDDVRDSLEVQVAGGPRIGELVAPHLLTRTSAGAVRYAVTPGAFGLDVLPGNALRALVGGLGALVGDLPLPGLEPLTVGIATEALDGGQRLGVRLGIERTGDLELLQTDGLRLAIEADARWVARALDQDPAVLVGGVELFLLTVPAGAALPELRPRIAVRGLGLRVGHSDPGQKLIDVGVTVRSIGVHGWYERSFSGAPGEAGGAHVELDQLGLPVGGAGGNPVAASFLSGDGTGEPADTSPAFSPALAVWSTGGPTQVDLRAGEGDGPWWIPIQQAFGPVYIDQLGFGVGRSGTVIDSVSVLLDGGASIAGLTIALDDLEVIVPWATPLDLTTWRLDLAGFAIGYSGSGLKVAGGLRKFDRGGHPDYVGMVQVTFPPYGATGVGAYGVFPDGGGGEYTSLFAFVAVTAPIGGPPAFFVTGLGGGFGLNRQLIAPDISRVHQFPLVTAFTGGMAADPMGALELLAAVFPPRRGALWFAAGLSFTTFVLVNTTAVLTVAIDGGLELNLFGLSKMQLPPAPAPVMVSVELALHARFSSQEAVLSVQAQLTDNSYIISPTVRLTGGFAFIIWFRTGQFLFTLGGYGPAFAKPSHYPVVPRVGFAWEPSGSVVIKGGGYFCLTSSCVMAGGELEVAYRSGSVWAALEAGIHVLVSWDPFAYDFRFYVSVSAGVRWKTWLGTISFSFDFGVYVHIVGPELRGSATLDLDVTSVTVRFGPSSTPSSDARIGFTTFLADYVLEPPGDGGARHALAASVSTGQLLPGVGATGGGEADPETADDGSTARPWRVAPEFAMAVQTRAATNRVLGLDTVLDSVAARPLATGPTGDSSVTSTLEVRVLDAAGFDRAAAIDVAAEYGNVPEAVWRVVPVQPDVADEKLIRTCVGVRFKAVAVVAPGRRTIDIDGADPSRVVHPLPFRQERQASGGALVPLRDAAGDFEGSLVLGSSTRIAELVAELVASSEDRALAVRGVRVADHRLRPTALLEDRAAPPRVVSLAHGMAETDRPAVERRDRDLPVVDDPAGAVAAVPRLESVVRASTPAAATGVAGTVSGSMARTTVDRRAEVRRAVPPTLAGVQADIGTRLGADLRVGSPITTVRRGAVVIDASLPSTLVSGAGRRRLLVGVADPGATQLARATATKLVGGGVGVRPGDTQVWVRDGAEHDGEGARPQLSVRGTARVVAVDGGGFPMVDVVLSDGAVDLPVGTARVAVSGGDPGGGPAGWTATDALTEIADGTWLAGGGAVVRSAGSRGGQRADRSGTVRAAAALARSGRIETDLPPSIRTVVVALDGADGGVPEIAIAGADQVGRPVAVRHGGQTLLVTGVEPTADRITVGVAPNEGTVVGGVVGSPLPASTIAGTLATGGIGAIAPTGAPSGAPTDGVASITWKDGR